MEKKQSVFEAIINHLPSDISVDHELVNGLLVLRSDRATLLSLLTYLQEDRHCQCKMLVDLFGVDYPDEEKRFEVNYQLLSMTLNLRVLVKVRTDEETSLPSVTELFGAAGWYEREVWDMYGVHFTGNKDLRRILTDYGFEGHPLRKDFPLTGHVELRYDNEKKCVAYEPVKLEQAFRSFDMLTPWQGTECVLPGDEKAQEGS